MHMHKEAWAVRDKRTTVLADYLLLLLPCIVCMIGCEIGTVAPWWRKVACGVARGYGPTAYGRIDV